MDELPADGADEHAVVLDDFAPVPVLGGKFQDVAVGIVSNFGLGRPKAGGDAGGVFGAHGYLNDGYRRCKFNGFLLLATFVGLLGGSGWFRGHVVARGGNGRSRCAAGTCHAQSAYGVQQFQRRGGYQSWFVVLVLERFDEGLDISYLRSAGPSYDGPHVTVGAVEANRHGRTGQIIGRRTDATDAERTEHVHLPDRGWITRNVGDAVGTGGDLSQRDRVVRRSSYRFGRRRCARGGRAVGRTALPSRRIRGRPLE